MEAVDEDVEDFRAGGSITPDLWEIYKVAVQATLLFGAELWVMSP